MKFGRRPVASAEGCILAHSIELADADSGPKRLRKGTVLDAGHLRDLQASGYDEVIVAQLEPGDLHEDAAAARLATALAGEGIEISAATTGRVNLRARGPGLVALERAKIDAVNAVNPMITVATVPPLHRLEPGGMVATIKIISYAVPERDLAQAAAVGEGALAMVGPNLSTASLIETQIGSETPSAKGRAALEARLARLGVRLDPRVVVAHEAQAIARALTQAEGALLFVLTASATSDWLDTAPQAVRAAGGEVLHFGMPVDPGNLLFIGDLGGRGVIGLPGCARSPALNGADWVLERMICGIPVGPKEIAAMGVGGLLKEIAIRPMPRGMIDQDKT